MSNFAKLMMQAAAGAGGDEPFEYLEVPGTGFSYTTSGIRVYDISSDTGFTSIFYKSSVGGGENGETGEPDGSWDPYRQDGTYYANHRSSKYTRSYNSSGTVLDTFDDADTSAGSYQGYDNPSAISYNPDFQKLYTLAEYTNDSSIYRWYYYDIDASDPSSLSATRQGYLGVNKNAFSLRLSHYDHDALTLGYGFLQNTTVNFFKVTNISDTTGATGGWTTINSPAVYFQGYENNTWSPAFMGFDKNVGGKAGVFGWRTNRYESLGVGPRHQIYLTNSSGTVVATLNQSRSSWWELPDRATMVPQYIGDRTIFYIPYRTTSGYPRIAVYEVTGGSFSLKATMTESTHSVLNNSGYDVKATAVDSARGILYFITKNLSNDYHYIHMCDVSDPTSPGSVIATITNPFSASSGRECNKLRLWKASYG